MSFGEESPKIGNIDTVEVLIFNPNDPYISVHSKRGSVTHSSSRDAGIDGGSRTAGSHGHDHCSHSSTAQMSVSQMQGVAC